MSNIYDLADTWNDSGTTFTAIKMNVTDSASNAASLLMDLQVGGTTKFKVTKGGHAGATGFGVGPGGSNISDESLRHYYSGANFNFFVKDTRHTLGSDVVFGWGATAGASSSAETALVRDAAYTLAQRNGTNAQAFRFYQSYTDGSNYTRGALSAASSVVQLAAESAGTGDANIDVQLTPKGTGRVRFGTHSAIGAETVTGYITIKDSAGTERKVAVVS